jgi:hypothetical protein
LSLSSASAAALSLSATAPARRVIRQASVRQHDGDSTSDSVASQRSGDRMSTSFGGMVDLGSRACLFVAGVTLVACSIFAQALDPTPTRAAPLSVQGESTPGAPARNLSEKLNQSNGAIHPKEVDPDIEKPVPKVGDANVAPPPGTSDGASAPKSKWAPAPLRVGAVSAGNSPELRRRGN